MLGVILIAVGVLVVANLMVFGATQHQRRPRGPVVKTPRGTAPMTWGDLIYNACRLALFFIIFGGPGLVAALWRGIW